MRKKITQQLDELKEMRGFWYSEEETLDLMDSRLWKRPRLWCKTDDRMNERVSCIVLHKFTAQPCASVIACSKNVGVDVCSLT